MSNYTDENLITTTVPNNVRAIKIGDKIFTGFYDMNGGSTEFYKCASVTQPSTQTFYTVSGAGITDINGDYEPTEDTSNGQPVYSLTVGNTTYYLFLSDYNQWGITSSDITDENFEFYGYTYYTSDDSAITSEWHSSGQGNSSTPPSVVAKSREVSGTWTGYKAVLSGGAYSYESSVTSGLSFSAFTPTVGKIYSEDALIEISRLYMGVFSPDILDAPLTSNETATGETLTTFHTYISYGVTEGGIPGAHLYSGGCIKYALSSIPSAFTLSGWVKGDSGSSGYIMVIGRDGDHSHAGIGLSSDGQTGIGFGSVETQQYQIDTPTSWHHYALTRNNTAFRLYIDGVERLNETAITSIADTSLYIGAIRSSAGDSASQYPRAGYYSSIRIYSRVLTASEIVALASEFTPVTPPPSLNQ